MPWEHSFCVMCKILLWFLYKNLDQTPKFPSNLNFNRKTFSEMALSFSLEVPHKLHSQQVCVTKDIPSEIPNSWKFVDVKMLCQSHPSNTHTDAHAQRVNGVSAYAKLHCDAVREYLSKIAEQDDYWIFFRKSSVIVKQSLTRPWLPAYMTLHTFMDCLWAPWHTPTVAICPALTPYWNPWIKSQSWGWLVQNSISLASGFIDWNFVVIISNDLARVKNVWIKQKFWGCNWKQVSITFGSDCSHWSCWIKEFQEWIKFCTTACSHIEA